MTGMMKNQSEYIIKCPICKGCFVPKFTIYTDRSSPILPEGKKGLTMQLLSPVVLYKEFINTLNKKGDKVLLMPSFVTAHSVVFWNLVLYFKIMKLPCFVLDQDTSARHLKVQVSWIMKYLPAGGNVSKQVTRSSFGS